MPKNASGIADAHVAKEEALAALAETDGTTTEETGGGNAGTGKTSKAAFPGNDQGERISTWRKVTLWLVFAAVIASLAFDSGIGTPSAFGVGQFFLLCPLGGLEAMVASRSFLPIAAISMAVVLVFTALFGRAWCAWGCPMPPVRRFFKREPEGADLGASSRCSALALALGAVGRMRYLEHDPRTWTLIAVLVAALVAGLPLFCLVCPIGLTFGSVASLWHLIVDKQLTFSVVVFPLALVIETVVYRKWCLNLCPVAGLLGIFGQASRLFLPHIEQSICLKANGGSCDVCTAVCSERIDKHADTSALQLGECTRCGACAKHCPTGSIVLK